MWIKTPTEKEAVVIRPVAPRSYQLQTKTGVQRRNRRHLNVRRSGVPAAKQPADKMSTILPPEVGRPTHSGENGNIPADSLPSPEPTSPCAVSHDKQTVTTRSGRIIKKPDILDL